MFNNKILEVLYLHFNNMKFNDDRDKKLVLDYIMTINEICKPDTINNKQNIEECNCKKSINEMDGWEYNNKIYQVGDTDGDKVFTDVGWVSKHRYYSNRAPWLG